MTISDLSIAEESGKLDEEVTEYVGGSGVLSAFPSEVDDSFVENENMCEFPRIGHSPTEQIIPYPIIRQENGTRRLRSRHKVRFRLEDGHNNKNQNAYRSNLTSSECEV
ncbi:hypothetical protein GJ496_004066 [Pomphorhynchus laevis]|nr:hypothetical protein GJ496_004066 [Pomphorhynchus laevis]